MRKGLIAGVCGGVLLGFTLACGGGGTTDSAVPADDADDAAEGKSKKSKDAKGKDSKDSKEGKEKSKNKSKGKGDGKDKGKAGKKPHDNLICCRDSNNPYIYYYAWMERRDCNASVYDYEVVPDYECHAADD